MLVQKATEMPALGISETVVTEGGIDREQTPPGFRHFPRDSQSLAALQGLRDRPAGRAGTCAQSARADESFVAADGCRIALACPRRRNDRTLGKPAPPFGLHLSAAIRGPRSGAHSDTAFGRRRPFRRHRECATRGAQARDPVRKRPGRLALCLRAGRAKRRAAHQAAARTNALEGQGRRARLSVPRYCADARGERHRDRPQHCRKARCADRSADRRSPQRRPCHHVAADGAVRAAAQRA